MKRSIMKLFITKWCTCFLLLTGYVNLVNAQKILTFENSLEIAILNSPDIIQSELNMTMSRETLNANLAALKSRFSLNITPLYYSQDRTFDEFTSDWNTNKALKSFGNIEISQPIKFTDGRISIQNRFEYQDAYSEISDKRNIGYNNNLFLQLSQPLFTYNKTKMDLNRNRLHLENATLNYAIQKLFLEKNVTQAFYAVYQKQMAKKISEEEFQNQQISYEIIKYKVEGGLSAKEELYQAELNLATSKSSLKNNEVDLENAKDVFKKLIGVSLYDSINISADIQYQPVMIDLEKAISHGLQKRMELRQKQIDIQNSQFDLITTQATNEFIGNVDLSIGLIGDNKNLGNIYDKTTKSPRFLVSFTIPIWDWGERKARIRASEAEIKTRVIQLEDQKNDIIINIREVYRSLQNLVNQIEIAQQNEKNAQLTYEINLERYKNGDLTSMDLNLFQTQLSEKKMNLSNALINYKLELLNLKIQTLWDFEKNSSIVLE